jgi:hypothetical protein
VSVFGCEAQFSRRRGPASILVLTRREDARHWLSGARAALRYNLSAIRGHVTARQMMSITVFLERSRLRPISQ